LQAQLSGLVIQNEALDSLVDATQWVSSGNYIPDSTTLALSYIEKGGLKTVIDTTMAAYKVNVAADTLGDSIMSVQNKAQAISLKEDSLVNKTNTGKTSNGLLTISGTIQASQPEQHDSSNNRTNISHGSKDFLTGNPVFVPDVNKEVIDTASIELAHVPKDTMELQAPIATEDSLDNKISVNQSSKDLPIRNTAIVPVVNKKATDTLSANKAAVKDDIAVLQDSINTLEDSLRNKASINQSSKDLSNRNTVIIPVVNKKVIDTLSANKAESKDDIAMLQKQIKVLEDSLSNKNYLNKDSKELLKGNVAVNKATADTLSVNRAEAKDDIATLQSKINKLEDSLKNSAIVSKNSLLTASSINEVSQQQPKASAKNKTDAGKASQDLPSASDSDEVSRLRSELSSLQKENEGLSQQLDKTSSTPVSSPEKDNQVSGNENVATQDDINALKSEIKSLQGTIKANSNNQVTTSQRNLLPPIVPAIGIGVGKTKVEQVIQHDTIFVERPSDTINHIDTFRLTDTFLVRDTLRISDTVKQVVRDTVQQTVVKDSVVTMTNVIDKQKESLLALPPLVILFDLGKSNVKLVYRKRLDYYAAQLKQHKDLKVVITGHTDKIGSVANNLILSEKRAKSISDYLISKGVKDNEMQLNSLGETDPITENDTKDGQSQNRRVELIFGNGG
jgi:outer membrane protein OmpA-like peptidoglycan-associated protein